jgi:hypothetical protein
MKIPSLKELVCFGLAASSLLILYLIEESIKKIIPFDEKKSK